ncbi:hypothetical protein EDC18_104110 [Natranaerovirga pectinivora]|uniref:Twitching motility protein PilT n=1 Tax=Natranaerovirga pectinivora TaxID=682400 RepID=A0A4R3MNL3_9FIRM|nr:twitching motility protein PilT [Natranaerovirga pectinivora]TCT14960.1 hypothetical protein EDC18_104110 [Natranaerovirga pectinivora]
MISIVAGDTGEGKTRQLISMANKSVKTSKGNIVFIDKCKKYSYEINHKVRLINTGEFPLMNANEFYGFVCGILSEDHDIHEIYFDELLKLAKIDIDSVSSLIDKLKKVSDRYNVHFIISISCELKSLPEYLKEYLVA